MANIKTATLTAATEQAVSINGTHCIITNRTGGALYASANSGITADADGVKYIADGTQDIVCDTNGTVYLLAPFIGGKVQCEGTDFANRNFKSAGGNGSALSADGTTITNNDGIISANYSGENLLDNPDFAINQRGNTSYSGANVYTVDRWYTGGANVTVDDGYLIIAPPNATTTASLRQKISRGAKLSGKTITASVDCDLTTDGSRITLQLLVNGAWTPAVYETQTGRRTITRTFTLPDEITTDIQFAIMLSTPATAGVVTQLKLYSAKIESGSAATPIIPPDPAQELAKCQRYLQKLSPYEVIRASFINPNYIDFSVPTPVSMRATTISISGTAEIYPIPVSTPITDFTISVATYAQNQLRLRATKTAHGLTDAILSIPSGGSVLLSAEL